MKVLLFANDLMPFGALPTSGGGLRCFQLMKGLEAHGVEVVASMPGFTFLAKKHFAAIPERERDLLWHWETQDTILRRVKPDAVLFASNWDHFNLSKDPDVPVIIDLHGSRLIETTMWGSPVSTDRKVEVLSRADCLLCAGLRQRSYFSGWLVQAGRVPGTEHFIRYVPISLAPEMPEHVVRAPEDDDAPFLVSGGGWFPWQNQARTVFAACREVTRRNRGRIEIYGTPHETPHETPEEQAIRSVYRQVQELGARSPRIQAQGYVGRDSLIEIYRRASVALEAMSYNLERELAFTTRTIEYLWCGLPVLYNDYGEVAEHIREYDAGWTVDPESEAEIEAALDEIFSDPGALARKSANAQRLVRDRFTWDKTVLPLLDFLRHPQKAPRVAPVVGAPIAEPSYLRPRGPLVEISLPAPARLRQGFVVPVDGLRAIDLPFRLAEDIAAGAIPSLTLRVVTDQGRVRAQRLYRGPELASALSVGVAFPWHATVTAGATLFFDLDLQAGSLGGSSSAAVAVVSGVPRAVFPLQSRGAGEQALALHLSGGGTRMDRAKSQALRAWNLVRSGQLTRLWHAAARRLLRVGR